MRIRDGEQGRSRRKYSIRAGAILPRPGPPGAGWIPTISREFLHSQAACGRLWTPAPHVWARVKGCRVSDPVRLYRWDEIALEKVTEMVSRKFITGHREMLAQVYLKRGA